MSPISPRLPMSPRSPIRGRRFSVNDGSFLSCIGSNPFDQHNDKDKQNILVIGEGVGKSHFLNLIYGYEKFKFNESDDAELCTKEFKECDCEDYLSDVKLIDSPGNLTDKEWFDKFENSVDDISLVIFVIKASFRITIQE